MMEYIIIYHSFLAQLA